MTEIHLPDRGPHAPFRVGPGVEVVPLRTPTLPPATHTNCVLLGGREVVVVDPASPYEDEQQRLVSVLGERSVREIWLTHHHFDHVGGAAALRDVTGAPVRAHPGTVARLTGVLAVDEPLYDRDCIELEDEAGAPLRLEALHTPGHARGHLAFRDVERRTLVAGDLVAGQGTIVIDPPEGDMADYLATLGRLVLEGLGTVVPAHGPAFVAAESERKLLELIAHRQAREQQVLGVLGQRAGRSGRSLDLVPAIYPEIPPMFHPLAARQVLAHLLKLEAEGRVDRPDGSTGVPGTPVYLSAGTPVGGPEPAFRAL